MQDEGQPAHQCLPTLRTALAGGISWTKVSGHSRYRFESAGLVEFRSIQGVTAHVHPFYEFGLALSGKGELQLHQADRVIAENEVYMIEPGLTHRLVGHPESGLSCLLFQVRPESIDSERSAEPLPGLGGVRVAESNSLGTWIQSWVQLHRAGAPDRVSLSLFMRLLAAEIMAQLSDFDGHGEASLVLRAQWMIEQALPGKIEVSKLSQELGVSDRTLRRHFQSELGQSVMGFIHMRRLQLAQTLLTHHLSVAEVAERVGFESAGQLSRLFRKAMGISPKRWQQAESPTRRLPVAKDG